MTALALPLPRFMPRLTKHRTRAFGLLEIILVFAIVIGAAAVVFTAFGFAHASSEGAAIVDETNLVSANLRASPWGAAHDFTQIPGGWSNTYMPGIFPASWNQDGKVVEPITGNAVWIGPGYATQPNTFSVLINYVPDNDGECQRVGSALAAQGYDNVMFAAASETASGGTIFETTGGPLDPPTTHTIDPAKLASYCAGTGGDPGDAGPTPGYSGFQVIGH